MTYEKMKDRVMDELKKSFRPEFLNRIDEVIVFHSLTQEDVKQIVDLLMKRVTEQLKAKDLDIELTDAAKTFLAEKGYDPSLGARPLRSAPSRTRCPRGPCGRSSAPVGRSIIVDAAIGDARVRGRGSSVPPVELRVRRRPERVRYRRVAAPRRRPRNDGPGTTMWLPGRSVCGSEGTPQVLCSASPSCHTMPEHPRSSAVLRPLRAVFGE